MRVVLLASSLHGTAAHHLPALLSSGCCEVAMVVLSEGRPANKRRHYRRKLRKLFSIGPFGTLNGMRMRSWYRTHTGGPALDALCAAHHIPFHVTPGINTDRTRALFRMAAADLGISLGNGYIAPSVFSIPTFGMINIHHELLPDYQNAPAVIWQLYNGSAITGYTIHKIDKRIDTGEILLQERMPVQFGSCLKETVKGSMRALLEASSKGLVQVLCNFSGYFNQAEPQGPGKSYTTPSLWQFLKIRRNHRLLAGLEGIRAKRSGQPT